MLKFRYLAVLLAAALLCTAAFALEVPELSRTGSIRVVMRQGQTVVSGGTLALYRVGDIEAEDGDYRFRLTAAFAESQVPLEEPASAHTAQKLAAFAQSSRLTGQEKAVAADGSVTFSPLQPGLYLLVQPTAAEGYDPAAPFLVSVPLQQDGAYCYEVDASPKVEVKKAPASTPPQGPNLPQTGQLNWPVPVLGGLGLILLAVGGLQRARRGKYEQES